jgi:SAM-dependent MidA family methyltransferase
VGSKTWTSLRQAWESALYGPNGFYRSEQPADHFRTSAHASPLFADALLNLIRRERLEAVVDLGAGGGELLSRLATAAPELHLTGVDVRARPRALSEAVSWQTVDPAAGLSDAAAADDIPTLLLANELLDNVACEVVELDDAGVIRIVQVDLESGDERLGGPAGAEDIAWLDRWWPLTMSGQRAEVGLPRDVAWGAACGRIPVGICLAIDYGHTRDRRPVGSTLTSYRSGRQSAPTFDGRHDVTSDVAADAVAATAGGELRTQRAILRELGLVGTRPDLARATTAPRDYLRALATASSAAELTASPGLGDFWWILGRRP